MYAVKSLLTDGSKGAHLGDVPLSITESAVKRPSGQYLGTLRLHGVDAELYHQQTSEW